MSVITTHVLDTALGRPAVGVPVRLEQVTESGCTELGRASTDSDGRVAQLSPAAIGPGTYRLVFDTAAYAAARAAGETSDAAFFPEVAVTFSVPTVRRLVCRRGYGNFQKFGKSSSPKPKSSVT